MSSDYDDLIFIANYIDPTHAQLAKIALEDAGIDCFLQGENTAHMFCHYNVATGGVRLYVRKSQADAAMTIIQNLESHASHEPIEEIEPEPETETTPEKKRKFFNLRYMLVCVVILFIYPGLAHICIAFLALIIITFCEHYRKR